MSDFDDLLRKHLDGLATDGERQELDRRLAESPEAAEAYARASRLDQALDRHFRHEQAISVIQGRIRGHARRRVVRLASAAAALLIAIAAFFLFRSGPALFVDGEAAEANARISGRHAVTFPGESTRFDLSADAVLQVEALRPAKRFMLAQGSLRADVAPQAAPMILTTSNAVARVLGTRFMLSASAQSTRLEVTEGKVNLSQGPQSVDVKALEWVEARAAGAFTRSKLYEDRFAELRRDLLRKGYFSPDGIPYHSVETLIVDAPDYGHLTTSETMSYWLWLEAMHGRQTGDWGPFRDAWKKMEEAFIPAEQPHAGALNPKEPATYAPEMDRIGDYPVALDKKVRVDPDPLFAELPGSLYIMHWLVDVDDFYGHGRRAFVNTFQRGPNESAWETIPHPSKDPGGEKSFLPLFIRDSTAPQWRYTGAPDADARVIQAAWWAAEWARERGQDPAAELPLAKAARMGDALRYALQDKYFRTRHHLIAWSQAWGGSLDPASPWAWRTGSSHVHFGYQNPVAAWALATDPLLKPRSPGAAGDWTTSVARQVEFYRWLQSAEGAIAGGATSSLNGRYEAVPDGTPAFHGLAYVEHPVFRDPPSNEWFGWQAWSMGRLAQYARLAKDPAAREVVDKWAAWARSVVQFTPDGGYSIPETLLWSGRPGRELHVSTRGETRDVGVAAALARALIAHGDPQSREVARELLDRLWSLYRDERGVSNPEQHPEYRRFLEPVEIPRDGRGALASGGALKPGATFLDLRPKYRLDPDWPKVEEAIRSGKPAEFRYHRFWAQVEVALANAELARLWK